MVKRNKLLSKKHSLRAEKLLHKALAYHKVGNMQEAEDLYQSILRKYPNHHNAMHLLGVIAFQVGNNDLAITRYKRALAIKPDDAEVHYNLGGALKSIGRIKEAIAHYEQALAIKPDDAEVHYNLGNALSKLVGREKEAIACYEQALVIKSDYVGAHNNLGAVYNSLGRMEEAITRYEQALAINPDNAETHLHLAAVNPKQEQVPVIEKLLTRPKVSDEDEMHYHYALGYISNDAKNYSKAFEHFHKANTYKRKTITYDSQNHSIFVNRLIKTYSKSYFQKTSAWGSDSTLPIFIVGMPRSGTTLIEQILSSHPQIHGAGELSYIRRIEETIANQFKTSNPYPECMSLIDDSIATKFSTDNLKDLKDYSQDAKYITDKMPDNFLRIGLIKTLFPKAQIIHCQRNALDTCTSIFLNYFVNIKGNEYSFDLTELGQYYLDYLRLMGHWHSQFPSEIFDVQYEALVGNQKMISRQLIEHLGLEWDERCLDFHKNKRAVKTASTLQVRKPIYKNSINRWKFYEEHLEPLKRIFQHHPKDEGPR